MAVHLGDIVIYRPDPDNGWNLDPEQEYAAIVTAIDKGGEPVLRIFAPTGETFPCYEPGPETYREALPPT